MSTGAGAASTRYDAVVIGAGIGGMTAAGLLAKAGKKVLVVEREPRPGGYAGATAFGGYQFDSAARLIMGCRPDGPFGPGPIHSLLSRLGVEGRCEFIRPDPFCRVILPGAAFEMRQGREAFVDSFCRVFPEERRNLERLLDACHRIYRGISAVWQMTGPLAMLRAAFRAPHLARYQGATLAQGLASYLSDEHARTSCGGLWPYLGLPPSRVSFLQWAGMMALYVDDGAFCCRGSMQRLADAFAEGMVRQGAEMLLDRRVVRILVERRRVQGVELEGGQRISAPVVLSGAEAPAAFRELLDPREVPAAYARRLERLEPCAAAASLCLATDLDLRAQGWAHESVIASCWDGEEEWRRAQAGHVGSFALTVPTIGDPGLAPPGQHLVSMTCFRVTRAKATEAEAEQRAQLMLAELEKHIPSIGSRLTVKGEGASARGYRLQAFGPMYGWAASPAQSGFRRLGQTTPIAGLYLVGHWTQPGHGVMVVALSGEMLARRILGG